MLDTIFLQIFDMTKVASLVILIVLLVRLCLKRAPKVISYALWAVVLFRLLCGVRSAGNRCTEPSAALPDAAPLCRAIWLLNILLSCNLLSFLFPARQCIINMPAFLLRVGLASPRCSVRYAGATFLYIISIFPYRRKPPWGI